MRAGDFSVLPAGLPLAKTVLTLGELSQNDEGDLCVVPSGYCENLSAISFDEVKSFWYGSRFFNQVRSCDALYIVDEHYYLIEFKTGKPDPFDLHRKIYDSVIGLMEHNVLTLDECRNQVQYLIVSKHYRGSPLEEYLEESIPEPWDYEVTHQSLKEWQDREIRKLTNFLFNKVFRLSVEEFDAFAKRRGWSN